MRPLRIAIAGFGKIARDQHLPAIAANPAFELVATVDPRAGAEGVPGFASFEALRADGPAVDAVSICTPPASRHELAAISISNGWHTMLEKPPAATVAEAENLASLATASGVTLFASWHSRAAPGVEPARAWLQGRTARSVRIDWLEDIREWHPGQEWILAPGGFGVFDPGINALSILTAILPGAVRVDRAVFDTPRGRACPIAALLEGSCGEASFEAHFDFLKEGAQIWTIDVETDAGTLSLRDGGATCVVGDRKLPVTEMGEYPILYRQFNGLIYSQSSDVDLAPLRIVEATANIAERRETRPFNFYSRRKISEPVDPRASC